MRWERLPLQQARNGPGKRWGHTCNSVKGGRFLYLFGGYGRDNCQTNQVHVFDTALQTWSQPEIKGVPPTPRDSHTCTTVGDNLFVFGGTDGMNPLNDLHILDTSSHTWISPMVRGEGPEAREGHSAALVGKRLFVFGGCGKSSITGDEVYYNDVYILNTETFVWKEAVTSGIPPSARDSHTCSSWKNKFIVIGGEDGNDYYLSDVHILDADTLVWKELSTAGEKLSPRAGHSAVALGKHLFVFGGFTDCQNLYDDLYLLDIETGVWAKVTTTGIGPSARFSVAGDCLDPRTGGVLVFLGGCNKSLEALDDMYYLHTGLASVRDDQWLEKLSLRKQLKLKCQEQSVSSPLNKALVQIDSSAGFHQGKKTFSANVTESFRHGYNIETVIDGKLLRGIVFANQPPFSEMANQSNIRKRAGRGSGSKSKASRSDKHDAIEPKAVGSHDSTVEADVTVKSKSIASAVSPHNEISANKEPSVAPLNLNEELTSDVPDCDSEPPKENSMSANDFVGLFQKQDASTEAAEIGNIF